MGTLSVVLTPGGSKPFGVVGERCRVSEHAETLARGLNEGKPRAQRLGRRSDAPLWRASADEDR